MKLYSFFLVLILLFLTGCGGSPDDNYIKMQIRNDLREHVEKNYGNIVKDSKGRKYTIISKESGDEGFEVVYEVKVFRASGSEEDIWRTLVFVDEGGTWRYKGAYDTPIE